MLVRLYHTALIFSLAAAGSTSLFAQVGPFTFENIVDSTALTNQYTGATFSNAIVLTSGVTLDEFEFPTHSGSNVASDNGGPITIQFAAPVAGVAGYFTYSQTVTMQAFDGTNTLLATATSAHTNNEGLSGVSGSQPGELMRVVAPAGISKVVITGNALGTSFTVDDLGVITKCDLNQDGQVTAVDAQTIINQALGDAAPANDLSGGATVSAVDAQIVLNAVLGRGCLAR